MQNVLEMYDAEASIDVIHSEYSVGTPVEVVSWNIFLCSRYQEWSLDG